MQSDQPTLEPSIGITQPSVITDRVTPETSTLPLLHNEPNDASLYPLRIERGEYFSEVIGPGNPLAAEYMKLIRASLEIIQRRADSNGRVCFSDVLKAGSELQALDAAFAERRLGHPLDSVHSLAGPDATHPYAKLTVARTAFCVLLPAGNTIDIFFEKFLVNYSFRDDRGELRQTVTPIHSHPLNFETVYFICADDQSCVCEQEFLLQYDGIDIVREDGTLSSHFLEKAARGPVELNLRPGRQVTFGADPPVLCLAPFESDKTFARSPELLDVLDGYFRAHQVTVGGASTRYFALDNYFSPTGRVILYGGTGQFIWKHDAWLPVKQGA